MQQILLAIGVLAGLGGGITVLLLIANRFLCNYGPCTIQINDEESFTIDGGVSLLDALYEKKIFIPSACGGQGTCGFCKVQVLGGGGPTLPTEEAYLNAEEQKNQTRLACQVKVKQDMVVHVREDYLNVQEFQATVSRGTMMTDDTREIGLKLIEPNEIEFHPGQYVQIRVPGHDEVVYRAYSISSAPSNKGEIELLVRLIPGGLGSTYLHELEIGEDVTFTGPYGEFELAEDMDTEIICVGGGCGMAPMRSILRHVAEIAPDRSCWLFFGARTHEDVMYLNEFKELQKTMPNLRVHYSLSEPEHSPDWAGETGYIHTRVEHHIGQEGKRQAFLCGPPVMIDATMEVLGQKQFAEKDVFYDKF